MELTARKKSARDVSSRAGCIGGCMKGGFSSARNKSPILLDLSRFFSGCLIRAAASWKMDGLRVLRSGGTRLQYRTCSFGKLNNTLHLT